MYDLVCIGVSLVDSIIKGFNPDPISKAGYFADSGTLSVGGEAVNQSVTASKLGLNTAIVTGLGYDGAADLIIHSLDTNHVDWSHCVRSEEIHTPVTTMFVNEDGTRKSCMNLSHRYNFHPEKHMEVLEDAKAISEGSLFRPPFNDPEIIYALLSRAKELGLATYVDTKLPNYNKLSLEDIKKSLPLIDYIFPNEDEAAYYAGVNDPEQQADIFRAYGVKTAIVKLGARGCLMKGEKGRTVLPAMPIKPVDAIGAGDNFIAGFVTAKNDGATDDEALKFANMCGAVCTEYVGATTGIKSRQQVIDRFTK